MSEIELSFIIPLLNEEKNVTPLYDGLSRILRGLNKTYEIIFIDDGSSDGSWLRLRQLRAKNPVVSIVRFMKPYGQTAALTCGFGLARGETVVTMDADLQSDPEDIRKLLLKINEGYDVVASRRTNRRDPFFRTVLPSVIGNVFIRFFWRTELHDIGCTLKAYKSKVIKEISLFGEMHRFIPLLIDRNRYRVAEVEITHFPRTYGRSHYGFSRALKIVSDLLQLTLVKKSLRKAPTYIIQEQCLGSS